MMPASYSAPGQQLYACIHASEFPLQALLRLRPSLRTSPVAVLEGQPPLERVCAVNAAARREGLSHGMTRVEAESFAGIVLLRRSAPEEAAAYSALLSCAAKYTPSIEDARTDGDSICVLDLAGTEKLFGAPLDIARRLAQELANLGIQAAIAVSVNFHTAMAMARSGNGFVVVPAGEEQQALAPLLLSALPLSAEQLGTLALWGIRTLGGLAALPEKALVARMGQVGKRLRALARGAHPHLFQPVQPSFELRESYEFDAPVAVLDSLLFVLAPILDQLLLRAQERALSLASLHVVLQLEGGGEHLRFVRPALPSADRKLLLKLLHLDLAAHPPAAAVLSLDVTAQPGDAGKVQLGLFSPQLPESTRLDVTLARLRALVGEACVGSPQLQDTHAPDSFTLHPFAVQSPGMKEVTPARVPALRRVRPPLPLAMQVAGTSPSRFWYDARQYEVVQAIGPWRVSGNWWSTAVWSREQWDVVAAAGSSTPWRHVEPGGEQICCCVAHDLLQQRWVMEAVYD